jgi:hypothetical protein
MYVRRGWPARMPATVTDLGNYLCSVVTMEDAACPKTFNEYVEYHLAISVAWNMTDHDVALLNVLQERMQRQLEKTTQPRDSHFSFPSPFLDSIPVSHCITERSS